MKAGGLVGAPPLVVLEDERPLPHNGKPKDCTGQYNFAKKAVVFSPGQDGASHRLALRSDFPTDEADPVWWVFSGMKGEASFSATPDLAGQTLTAQVVAQRLPGSPPKAAVLSVGDQKTLLTDRDETLIGSLSFVVPDGDWSIAITSPRGGGPHLQLTTLTLSNGSDRIDLLGGAQ